MKFSLNVPNYGTFSDPALMTDLAREAEASGWDGLFLWDHIQASTLPLSETWVLLAAIAAATERIRLGPMVTPLPRRRPWRLAREAVTLDRLSQGRLTLGLGLGDDAMREYSAFGEGVNARTHGEMLDEGLAVLEGLWSGEWFSFQGEHFQLDGVQFHPKPVQQPRIPVWLAGGWPSPRPFRRAARWDGVVPVSRHGPLTTQECRDIVAFIGNERGSLAGFDVTITIWYEPARTLHDEAGLAASFEAAGATWCQLSLPQDIDVSEVQGVIRRGPPRKAGV